MIKCRDFKVPAGGESSNRTWVSDALGQTITLYAKGANGIVAPKRTIGGSNTGFISPKASRPNLSHTCALSGAASRTSMGGAGHPA